MIFDTHAHYNDQAFEEDRKELIESLPLNGIGLAVNVGADLKSTSASIQLAETYSHMYASVGVHPSDTGELNEENFAWLKNQTGHKKVVAVGEIGLDYYWDEPERDVQKVWFERQMELARETKLPVIIHSRDAAKDTLDMMKGLHAEEIGGVIHCFSYGIELAREFLNMGFYLGIGGVLTFNNAKKLKEVVGYMPLERIVLETDCPYLSPVPNRGKRNSSLNLPYVVEEISRIKQVPAEQIIEITNRNAKQMYRMEK